MTQNSAERQIADNQLPETVCAGGKSFADCDTAQELLKIHSDYEMNPERATANGNFVRLLDEKLICKIETCKAVCHLLIEVVELKPSGRNILVCDPPGTKITT